MNVILCNLNGHPTAICERERAHERGLRHLAVSSMVNITSRGWLIQKRSPIKKLFRDTWSNSCCTHLGANETPQQCAIRRAEEELGLRLVRLEPTGTFVYELGTRILDLQKANSCTPSSHLLKPNP